MRADRWGPWWALDKVQQCRVHIAHLLRQKHILIKAFSSLEKTATFPFIYSGAVCCRDAQQTTLKFLFRPEFSDLKLENTAKWKNENKFIFRYQSCKNVPIVPTSWCYFFWPVLIFGKSTRKTGENRRKHAKTGEKQALFWC